MPLLNHLEDKDEIRYQKRRCAFIKKYGEYLLGADLSAASQIRHKKY